MEPEVPGNRDCWICSNKEDNITLTKVNGEKILRNFNTYLNPSIIIKPLENETQVTCCNYCYESSIHLTVLDEQVKNLQKERLDFCSLVSETVLERRSLVEHGKEKSPQEFAPQLEKCITIQKNSGVCHSVAVLENATVNENGNLSNELPSYSQKNSGEEDLVTNSLFDTDEHTNATDNECENIHSDEQIDVKYSYDETISNLLDIANKETEPNRQMSTPNAHSDQEASTTYMEDLLKSVRMPTIQLKRIMPDGNRNSPKITAVVGEVTIKSEKDMDENKPHKCSICGQGFTKMLELRSHNKLHYKEHPYKCSFCDKSFLKPSTLKKHKKIHTKKRLYKCTFCSKSFNRAHTCKEHERIHSEEEAFICSFCGKSFKTLDELKDHERIHSGDVSENVIGKENEDLPNELPSCSQRNSEEEDLGTNSLLDTEEHDHECEIGIGIHSMDEVYVAHSYDETIPNVVDAVNNETVPNQETSATNAHGDRNAKTTEKQADLLKCVKMPIIQLETMMPESSTSSPKIADGAGEETNKEKHMNGNENKPYKCSFCSSSFLKKYVWKIHESRHSEDRPFKCSICPHSFRRKDVLQAHEQHHSEIRPFLCSVCGKSFKRSTDLTRHRKIHTVQSVKKP